VYIADWKRTGERGNWAACWKLGYFMFDAAKPKPMTSAQYAARWRKKKTKEESVSITTTDKGIRYVSK
jgi:hypothetical protein